MSSGTIDERTIRERALRKAASEMMWLNRKCDGGMVTRIRRQAADARQQRLRQLLEIIDAHDGDFSDEEIRQLAWQFYETEGAVRAMIEARADRMRRRAQQGLQATRRFKADGGDEYAQDA